MFCTSNTGTYFVCLTYLFLFNLYLILSNVSNRIVNNLKRLGQKYSVLKPYFFYFNELGRKPDLNEEFP